MVALAALIVVIVALFLAAWGLRRREADDVHSVEGYRHTLDTLHELRQRSPSEEEEGAQAPAAPAPPAPPAPSAADQPPVNGHDDQHLVPGGPWVGRPVPHRVSRRWTAQATVQPDPSVAEDHERRSAMRATPPGGDALPRSRAEEPTAVHRAVEPAGSPTPPGEEGTGPVEAPGHDGGAPGRTNGSSTPGTVVVPVPGAAPGGNGSNGGTHLIFDDTAGMASAPASLGELEIPPRRVRAGGQRRPGWFRPFSFSWSSALVAILVVMVAGLGAYVAYSQTSHAPSGSHPATTAQGHHRSHRTTPTTAPAPTTTAPATLAPASATAGGATYSVPGPSYTVDLSVPAGSCWVQLTDLDTGQVLFSGTMAAGQQQAVAASGNTQLDIGAPHGLDVAVNRIPVNYPPTFATPFLMAFRPS